MSINKRNKPGMRMVIANTKQLELAPQILIVFPRQASNFGKISRIENTCFDNFSSSLIITTTTTITTTANTIMPPFDKHENNSLLLANNSNSNNNGNISNMSVLRNSLSSSIRSSFSSSSSFKRLKAKASSPLSPESSGRGVSFNPEIRVIETLEEEGENYSLYYLQHHRQNQHYQRATKAKTWYTDTEISIFQQQACDTIRRFQRKRLSREDCLRGLECQTTRCTASKLRIAFAHDLILNEKRKREIADPNRLSQMLAIITTASEEEALEIARQDAEEARMHHGEKNNSGDDDNDETTSKPFRCFFLEFPTWFLPHSKASPFQDFPA
jgi:hypothetical protein